MSLMNIARRQVFALLGDAHVPVLRVAGSRSICFSCAGKILRRAPTTTTRQVVRQGDRNTIRYLSKGSNLKKRTSRGYAAVALEAHEAAEDYEEEPSAGHHSGSSQHRPTEKLGPLDTYEKYVSEGRLKDDEFQRGIVRTLQNLHDELVHYDPPTVVHPTLETLTPKPKSLFASLFGQSKQTHQLNFPKNTPKGLYLYGDVGCGKTMLMDLFYDTLPDNVHSKTRIHFHHFMQDVHKRLHVAKMKYGNDFDAIPFVAADIAEQGQVLCFDEFQCTDVADAMILRRLIESLISHGVVIISTSNRHPDDLYKNGVQRASFIPCIELLKTRLHVVTLDSDTDYRSVPRPRSGVYHHPLGREAVAHANKWFAYFGDPNDPPHPEVQHIWGRDIKIPLVSGRAAKFNFMDICGSPLSAADYLELTKWYDAFIITDMPQMSLKQRDLARRFITFLDALYEAKARLVITSAVPLNEIFVAKEDFSGTGVSEEAVKYTLQHADETSGLAKETLEKSGIFAGAEEVFAFQRAQSRLNEMGGQQWIGSNHQ